MYNIGIVGSSFIACEFIESTRNFKELNVSALYSRTQKKGLEFCNDNNIETLYTNYTELLNNQNIQIIYIATPNVLHYKQALEAIRAHKHVIIEKPIALTSFELENLYKEAKKYEVIIMEAIVNIHYNTFKKVNDYLKEIGEVHYVNFFLQQQTRHFKDYKEGKFVNVFSKQMGGGALRDLGPYVLYPLLYFFGFPKDVKYFPIKNDEKIDESTTLMCSYPYFYASLNVSKLVRNNQKNIISGTNGYIIIDNINTFDSVKLYDINNNLVNQINANYTNRMNDELNYFLNLLKDNKVVDKEFYETSLEVTKVIEKNYNI